MTKKQRDAVVRGDYDHLGAATQSLRQRSLEYDAEQRGIVKGLRMAERRARAIAEQAEWAMQAVTARHFGDWCRHKIRAFTKGTKP